MTTHNSVLDFPLRIKVPYPYYTVVSGGAMAIIKKNERDEYIVVHHVFGEVDVLDFLHATSHMILDKLCFDAKNSGQSFFRYRNHTYRMTLDKGTMFRVEQIEDDVTDVE